MIKINLNEMQSYVYTRTHLVTGHVYYDEFNTYQGVSSDDKRTGVPYPGQSRELDLHIAKWNKQCPETWVFKRVSLGEAIAYQATQKDLPEEFHDHS